MHNPTANRPPADPTVADTAGDTADSPPPGASPAGAPPLGFEFLGEIGRGGMGTVYRARDLALDREVAVKVLQERYAPESAVARRFVEEARITGQLQHPGVPAVYQAGTLPDGRPFLAMKLIRGDTLADLTAANAPVNTLAVFEAICQAVGYAHAHGVIHRDLKPQNVMVGAFGEVQVMDWGLAKLLADARGRAAPADPADPDGTVLRPEIRPGRDADTPDTQAGSVLGTPAYMSPEQAAGETDRIDRRSDVFGLGAILCVLLTGRPPYVESEGVSVRMKSLGGHTADAFARLDACGGEPGVVALCKQCLSYARHDRPADGDAVATRIAELRSAAADRARQAELAQAQAEVREGEQWKRRRAIQWAAGVVATILTVAVVGVSRAYFRAETAEKETREQLDQTKIARDSARQRYDIALAAFSDMIVATQDKLSARSGTLELRRELLTGARSGLKRLLADADKDGQADSNLVWAYYRMGGVEETLGHFAQAEQEYQAGYDLATRLADADPANGTARHNVSAGLAFLGDLALRRKDVPRAADLFGAKLALDRQSAAAAAPGSYLPLHDLQLSLGRMGEVSLARGQTKEAMGYYEEKLRIMRTLADARPDAPDTHRDLAVAHELVGNAALYLQRFDLALDNFRQTHAIFQRLLDADPQNVRRMRDVAVAVTKLGTHCERVGKPADARDYYARAVVTLQRLAAADPQNIQAQTELLVGYDNLAAAEMGLGEYAKAAATFRKEREVIRPLHERKQLVGQFQNALAQVDEQIAACEKLAAAEKPREPLPPPRPVPEK